MLCTYILMWLLYSPLNFDEEIKPERLQIIRECTGELDGLCVRGKVEIGCGGRSFALD